MHLSYYYYIIFILCAILDKLIFALIAALLMLVGMFLPAIIFNNYPEISYKATIYDNDTQIEIWFDKFQYCNDLQQNSVIVTIDKYYTQELHWTDFEGYTLHPECIKINIPEGKQFEYDVVKEPKQTVEKCGVN